MQSVTSHRKPRNGLSTVGSCAPQRRVGFNSLPWLMQQSKKSLLIIIAVAIGFSSLFFFSGKVEAAYTIYNNPVQTDEALTVVGDIGTTTILAFEPFNPGHIKNIVFTCGGGVRTLTFSLAEATQGNTILGYTTPISCSNDTVTAIFNFPPAVSLGTEYFIFVSAAGGLTENIQRCNNVPPSPPDLCVNDDQGIIKLESLEGGSATSYINIDSPKQSETIPAPVEWWVSYVIGQGTFPEGLCLEVDTGTTSNIAASLVGRDGCGYITGLSGSTTILVDFEFPIGLVYAQAYIKTSTTTLATSTMISFNAISGGNPFENLPSFPGLENASTSISACVGNLFTINVIGCVSQIVYQTVNQVAEGFGYLTNQVKGIFPLNAIIALNNDFQEAQMTSTTTTLTLTIAGIELTFLDENTTKWLEQNTSFNYRQFVDYALYLITAIIVGALAIDVIKKFIHPEDDTDFL